MVSHASTRSWERMDGRTDGRTDDGRKVITIAHPEQSSGELKKSGGWIVIYNPTKNPIKLEENRCSSNAYTFYKNNLK